MRNFKHGDHIIYDNVKYYVSYPDKDGDHVFLTHDQNRNSLNRFNGIYFSNEIKEKIINEAEKLGYKYYFYPATQTNIRQNFKFATKQKLKNILNR